MKKLFFLLFFIYNLLPSPNGQGYEGSVRAQVNSSTIEEAFKSLKDDPSKVDSLNKLCREIEDNEKAIVLGIQVMKLAEKLGYKRGVAHSLNNIGVAFYNLEKGNESLEYYQKALKIREDLLEQANQSKNPYEIEKAKKDISASFNNIGNAYDKIGNKKEAISFHTQALKIKEEIKDTVGMARSYNNIASAYIDIPDYYKAIDNGFMAIKLFEDVKNRSEELAKTFNNVGNAYEHLKEYDKAMDYYQQALAIQQELGNETEIALMLNNIANIYVLQGEASKDDSLRKSNFITALEKYSRALDISEAVEDKDMVALVNSNIGNIYWSLNDFPKALTYLNKSLETYIQIDSKSWIASAYNNLCNHYRLQKKFSQSISYGLKALALADSIKDAEQIQNACEYLSGNYYDLKQFEKSLFYYKRYVEEKDKLINVEGAKKLVQEESRMEFEKKAQLLKAEQDKQNVIAEAESRRQKVISWSAGIGLVLFIIFSGFMYNRFRVIRKKNKIIEDQKSEVDHKNKALQGANAEIAQKNKDITDSIQYAKRIQRALLASDTLLKKNLPEYFVLYKPKDIVSGDFYWASLTPSLSPNGEGSRFLLCTADCTGHGVPGAFMSLLNISLLNEISLQRKITSPDLILNNVREQIISILNPEGTETESKDGMDCMLCSFDIKNKQLEFAAANNPLWILKNGSPEIEEYKPDKQPVGFHSIYKPFSLQTTKLEKGDIVYSFTDGFADQFGGPKGKKFKYKQLEELILANSKMPMLEQRNMFEKAFANWQGELEQVDDVLVIGVRI
ncbi:MAG: tetratricopeptide repeat protein [Bacteroidetes bacterium]|nr:MAG: tetratricopeptide repeat protein [Bacteroidota bacterium]